jgi:MFS family permease
MIIMVSFFLMLARFSESFLNYRGKELGFAITTMPFLMMLYNLVEAAAAFPVGKIADKIDKRIVFLIGIATLLIANCVVTFSTDISSIIFSIGLAGLHMGMTQGLVGALIAQSTPAHLKGTGFAVFYLVAGLATFIANYAAGHLSEYTTQLGYGVKGAFIWGIIATSLACLVLVWWILQPNTKSKF